MIWIIVLAATAATCVFGIVYMIWAIGKFQGIEKISKGNKKIRLTISFGIIAAFFLILCFTMSMVNAVVIFVYAVMFRLLFGLAGICIKRFYKEEFRFYLQGWLTVIACLVYFGIGYYLCNNVWITEYNLNTDKDIGELDVMMFADSHLGATFDGEGFERIINKMMDESPDIVLLPGDFVDDGTTREDMIKACEVLGNIETKYGVWFSYGNHDRGYYGSDYRGFSEQELVDELEKNHVHILKDEAELVGDRFYLIGRDDAYVEGRTEISELMDETDGKRYTIVLDHQPTDYDNEASAKADLVLSGHTHGGQLFPFTYVGEWMGVNDRTYGYERRDSTDFIVTSGISDWEIKFKTGTKSECVMIHIR